MTGLSLLKEVLSANVFWVGYPGFQQFKTKALSRYPEPIFSDQQKPLNENLSLRLWQYRALRKHVLPAVWTEAGVFA